MTRFNIIVEIDKTGGISSKGRKPWIRPHNMRCLTTFFRDKTLSNSNNGKQNVIIMGRRTWDLLDTDLPFDGRVNVVISKTLKRDVSSGIFIFQSFEDALLEISKHKSYGEVWVIGGEQIFDIAIKYIYLCNSIYVTKFKSNYECDQRFPYNELLELTNYTFDEIATGNLEFDRLLFHPKIIHQEQKYIELLKYVSDNGIQRPGVYKDLNTRSIFGRSIKIDVRRNIPILTTKKMYIDKIIHELLFFVNGKTNTKELKDVGIDRWDIYTDKNSTSKYGLSEGDIGQSYGFQLRHYNGTYIGYEHDYSGEGIDQLKIVIDGLRHKEWDNNHIFTLYNPNILSTSLYTPNHGILCQFFVEYIAVENGVNKKHISCMVYQQQSDIFNDLPYVLAFYSILLYMICQIVDAKPNELIINICNAYIYDKNNQQIDNQCKRTPYPWTTLQFKHLDRLKDIEDFSIESFNVMKYISHPRMVGDMFT